MSFLLRALVVAVPGLVLGCGYSPPGRVDTGSAGYKGDYEACDASVPDSVNKRNAKTGLAWFASPVRRWSQIDAGMGACMADKGWGRTRACTAEELRAGDRARQVVTSVGVRCVDPGVKG